MDTLQGIICMLTGDICIDIPARRTTVEFLHQRKSASGQLTSNNYPGLNFDYCLIGAIAHMKMRRVTDLPVGARCKYRNGRFD
jgi:hypothetical protein